MYYGNIIVERKEDKRDGTLNSHLKSLCKSKITHNYRNRSFISCNDLIVQLDVLNSDLPDSQRFNYILELNDLSILSGW